MKKQWYNKTIVAVFITGIFVAGSCRKDLYYPGTNNSIIFETEIPSWDADRTGNGLSGSSIPLKVFENGDSLFLHVFTETICHANISKGAPVNDMYQSFGLFAYTYSGIWEEDHAIPDLMFNAEIRRGTDNTWIADKTYHWPEKKGIRFFGYAPFGNKGFTIINTKNDAGSPKITYSVPDNVAEQMDILATQADFPSAPSGFKASLLFHHILTAITFKTSGNFIPGVIDCITIRNVYGTADITFGQSVLWSGHDTGERKPKDFVLPLNNTEASPDTQITDSENTLMMIPQTLPVGAVIEISYTDLSSGTEYPLKADISGMTWKPNQRIRYTLSNSSTANNI